jgi:hypothetical protein
MRSVSPTAFLDILRRFFGLFGPLLPVTGAKMYDVCFAVNIFHFSQMISDLLDAQ